MQFALLWGNLDKEFQSLLDILFVQAQDRSCQSFSISPFCTQLHFFALNFTFLHWPAINWHALNQSECRHCCLYIITSRISLIQWIFFHHFQTSTILNHQIWPVLQLFWPISLTTMSGLSLSNYYKFAYLFMQNQVVSFITQKR